MTNFIIAYILIGLGFWLGAWVVRIHLIPPDHLFLKIPGIVSVLKGFVYALLAWPTSIVLTFIEMIQYKDEE